MSASLRAPGASTRTRSAPAADGASPERIRGRDPLYGEIREFLDDEALLLEEERLHDWLGLLADDIRYRMPVRASVHRTIGQGFANAMYFYNDTRTTLGGRVARLLSTRSGWVEDPPSRTGRFVSGLRAFRTGNPEEFAVESGFLITRSRADLPEVKLLSGRRHDTLRRAGDGLVIARRDIYLHHSTIDMHNLAIFF